MSMLAANYNPMSAKSNHLNINHVAIIMDGNGRWANANNLSRADGHKKGANVAKDISVAASKLGIKYLTLYAFSSENWNRPQEEVVNLLDLLKLYLSQEVETFNKNNIKVQVIGRLEVLPNVLKQKINNIIKLTEKNSGMTLTIAFSYGARNEIADACQAIAKLCAQQKLSVEDINTEMFSSYLYTKGIPDPDLLIRTGGEHRISNFLLWQLAYTELYFTKTYWPDFTLNDLQTAISEFQTRSRRYGK